MLAGLGAYGSAALEPILGIRRHRADRAEKDVRRYRAKLIEAARRSRQAREERNRWRKERPVREEKLFLAVKDTPVSLGRISSTRQAMAALKEKERQLSEEAERREEERKRMVEKLDHALLAYRQAMRKVEKLEEVIRQFRIEEDRIEESTQDKEMEEFSVA